MSVYWQTWSTQWTDKAEAMDLANIDSRIKVVNISFSQPMFEYKAKSFENTGLGFSQSFDVVQKAIYILKEKGVKVMLSVGGATYPFPKPFNPWPSIQLCWDLGCTGIDIDWESDTGNQDDFAALVGIYRSAWPEGKFSSAVWSTGAYQPDGSNYRGINLKGLYEGGLDWINIMAYDAGIDFDPIDAYNTYKTVYKNKIYLGIELGQQAWGGHVSLRDEITNIINHVIPKGDDIFIWAYQKPNEGSPTINEIFTIRDQAHPKEKVLKQSFNCPNCNHQIFYE